MKTEDFLKNKRQNYRKTHERECKICNKTVELFMMVWRPGEVNEYCTNICFDCHTDYNKTCSVCKLTKRNRNFSSYQLKLKDSACKLCKPAKPMSEESKVVRSAYNKDPKNRKRATEKAKARNKERRKTDIQWKLKTNLRGRTYSALKGKTKPGSCVKELGCSVEFLKTHLENQFEVGMSWENYGRKPGQWSMDHILPLSKFDLTNVEQFKKASHYTNLRPMWHLDNIRKSNKT